MPNKRFVYGLFLLLIMLCSLTACGNSAKSEKEIAIEVSAADSIFLEHDLELTSYNIEKRQTNTEDKNDLVWLSITGNNGVFEYTADYQAVYVLYNDGWLLERCTMLDSEYLAISAFDKSAFEESLASEYVSTQFISASEDKNSYTATYVVVEETEYELYTYELTCSFTFQPATSWKEIDRTTELISKEVDFEKAGQYYIDKGEYSWAISYLEALEIQTANSQKLLNIAYEYHIIEMYMDLGYSSVATLDEISAHIAAMPEKTERIIEIETALATFNTKYGKWLGRWVSEKSSADSDSFDVFGSIRIFAEYDDGNNRLNLAIADACNQEKYTLCSADTVTDTSITYELWVDLRYIDYVDDDELLYRWTIELNDGTTNDCAVSLYRATD